MLESDIVAVYGSPRRHGNTATLLKQAVQGARDTGARVTEFVLRDLKISPCLEIYGCKKDGECVLKDDFQLVRDSLLGARGLILASPIFFYAVSAHTKIMIDRFQSLWVKKHWIGGEPSPPVTPRCYSRKGLFISVGATHGRKLFDGALLTVRYFFDVLDMELTEALAFRGLDAASEIHGHPEYLQQVYDAGRNLAQSLRPESGEQQ